MGGAGRPRLQLAAAIGAGAAERPVHAGRAEGAFERADPRVGAVRRQIGAAALAVRPHLKHANPLPRGTKPVQAAWTAAQMLSTTSATSPSSSPSAITRTTGSVPD